MVENIKISVVIPVYNNSETIERCLDSIYCQTYKNYECILADDCSDVDYSYLQEKYPSLIIVRLPKNSGAGVARQYALDNTVTGDWVIFVDSDDELYSRLVLSSFVHVIKRNPRLNCVKGRYIYNDEPYYEHMRNMVVLHGIFYNIKFLKDNNIRFHDTLRYHEDVYFNTLCRYISEKKYGDSFIRHVDTYYYRQNVTKGSVTQRLYNNLGYFEANLKYEVDMYLDAVNRLTDIVSIEEKKKILMIPVYNSFSLFYNLIDKKDKHIREMNMIKELARVFIRLEEEFGLNKKQDILDLFHKVENKPVVTNISSIVHSANGESVQETYLEKIWSMYLFYMNGNPIKKTECGNSPLLSIVCPVYNSKGIIRNTLDKLYTNINADLCEVILVNDCSPDGDYDYLKESYKNLIVVNNSYNMGYACSRQTGVDVATGKWLLFLDHDDEITDALMPTLIKLEYSDMPYQLLHLGVKFSYVNKKKDYIITSANPDLFHGTVFNLNYIKNFCLKFLPELKSSEDVYFHRTIYSSLQDKYSFLIFKDYDTCIYIWNITGDNQTSIMKNNRCWMEENYNDHVRAYISALNFNKDISLEYKIKILYRLYFEALTLSDIWSKYSYNFRTEIYDDIQLITAELYKCGVKSETIIDNMKHNMDEIIAGIANAIPLQLCNIVDRTNLKSASKSEYVIDRTINKKLIELAQEQMKLYETTL